MKYWSWLLVLAAMTGMSYAYWRFAIPVHRVAIHSELVMLGDLNRDHRWSIADLSELSGFLRDPFGTQQHIGYLVDVNQNGFVDAEDAGIIEALVRAAGDPYAAEQATRAKGAQFPRPRELYRYISTDDYRVTPLWGLAYPLASDSVLVWLKDLQPNLSLATYGHALDAELYSEAVRFDQAWRKRAPGLMPLEREYAEGKLARARDLWNGNSRYELLLALIELVEDAETLTVRNQPGFSLKLLALRDHLREVQRSPVYARFESGTEDWRTVLQVVSSHIQTDIGAAYDLERIAPPRDLGHLENYLQRGEWQYYKSATREDDFRRLIAYAQRDSRYLRSVARTSPRLQDTTVENHNLPMVLLFREAMRIKGGDKKKAVGLLDEAIRVPYAWVKTIPREMLPGSLALDNFLLPGNKEDGADKSRHWNVFGGICLYKSPQESLDLALKREMQDLRDGKYSNDAMREFFRDMIANLNGMYHVMTINPGLLGDSSQGG